MSRTEFTLRTEFITLGQLAKAAGIVQDGAEAKQFLAENPVYVNGEAENRRGRKLFPGDTVEFDPNQTVVVV